MIKKSKVRDAVLAAQEAALEKAQAGLSELRQAAELSDEDLNDASEIAQSSVDVGLSGGVADAIQTLRDSINCLTSLDLSPHAEVGQGSLVRIAADHYFVAVAAEDVLVDGTTVQSIAPDSPFGQAMVGKAADESFTVLGQTYRISQIS